MRKTTKLLAILLSIVLTFALALPAGLAGEKNPVTESTNWTDLSDHIVWYRSTIMVDLEWVIQLSSARGYDTSYSDRKALALKADNTGFDQDLLYPEDVNGVPHVLLYHALLFISQSGEHLGDSGNADGFLWRFSKNQSSLNSNFAMALIASLLYDYEYAEGEVRISYAGNDIQFKPQIVETVDGIEYWDTVSTIASILSVIEQFDMPEIPTVIADPPVTIPEPHVTKELQTENPYLLDDSGTLLMCFDYILENCLSFGFDLDYTFDFFFDFYETEGIPVQEVGDKLYFTATDSIQCLSEFLESLDALPESPDEEIWFAEENEAIYIKASWIDQQFEWLESPSMYDAGKFIGPDESVLAESELIFIDDVEYFDINSLTALQKLLEFFVF